MFVHTILIRKDPNGEVAIFDLSCGFQWKNRIYGYTARRAENGGIDSDCPCDWSRSQYERTETLAEDSELFQWASMMIRFMFRRIGEDCRILRKLPESFDWTGNPCDFPDIL